MQIFRGTCSYLQDETKIGQPQGPAKVTTILLAISILELEISSNQVTILEGDGALMLSCFEHDNALAWIASIGAASPLVCQSVLCKEQRG